MEKELCIGCDREAVAHFFCPCDLAHPVCAFHKTERLDCAHVDQWNDGEVTVAEMAEEAANEAYGATHPGRRPA